MILINLIKQEDWINKKIKIVIIVITIQLLILIKISMKKNEIKQINIRLLWFVNIVLCIRLIIFIFYEFFQWSYSGLFYLVLVISTTFPFLSNTKLTLALYTEKSLGAESPIFFCTFSILCGSFESSSAFQ